MKDQLYPFDHGCPKCKSRPMDRGHCRKCKAIPKPDHLHCTCGVCGFTWIEYPADAPESKQKPQ